MKSVKLYEMDSYLKEYACTVYESVRWEGKPALLLEETIFYPLGGGQPADKGTIEGIEVIDVQELDGRIYHVFEREHPFVPGQKVSCKIDWARRFDFMQQHTGEHILSGVVENQMGFQNVGFEINEEFMRVDYDGTLTKEQMDQFESEANQLVLENRKVHVSVPEAHIISSLDFRSKGELQGDVRIVDVEGVDICACCGTHVHSTAEVGLIKIIDSVHHRGGIRLTVLCGERALKDYRLLNEQSHELSIGLSAPSRGLVDSFHHQQELRMEEVRRMVHLEREILQLRLKMLTDSNEWVHFEDCLQGRDLAKLSATLAKKKERLLLLSGEDEEGYSYILTTKTIDAREVAKEMNAALSGKGGGKPDVVRGGLKATREDIEKWIQEHGNLFD